MTGVQTCALPIYVPLGSRVVSQKVNFLGQGNKGSLISSAVRRRTGEYPPARLLLPGGFEPRHYTFGTGTQGEHLLALADSMLALQPRHALRPIARWFRRNTRNSLTSVSA